MQHWCLDSNIWIGLARTPDLDEACELEQRVASGEVDVVLPLTVYLEAVATHNNRQRSDVAATIRRFWRGTSILPFAAAWKEELRASLAGEDANVRGRGLEHLCGTDLATIPDPPGAMELDAARLAFRDPAALLDLLTTGATEGGFFLPLRAIEEEWVQRVIARHVARKARRLSGENAVRADVAAVFFAEHYSRAWPGRGAPEVGDMLDLSSLAVYVEMETRRSLDQGDRQPQPNDVRDIMLLAVALPYCDVVVTEKRWGGFLTRTNLASRFGTLVEFGAGALGRALVHR